MHFAKAASALVAVFALAVLGSPAEPISRLAARHSEQGTSQPNGLESRSAAIDIPQVNIATLGGNALKARATPSSPPETTSSVGDKSAGTFSNMSPLQSFPRSSLTRRDSSIPTIQSSSASSATPESPTKVPGSRCFHCARRISKRSPRPILRPKEKWKTVAFSDPGTGNHPTWVNHQWETYAQFLERQANGLAAPGSFWRGTKSLPIYAGSGKVPKAKNGVYTGGGGGGINGKRYLTKVKGYGKWGWEPEEYRDEHWRSATEVCVTCKDVPPHQSSSGRPGRSQGHRQNHPQGHRQNYPQGHHHGHHQAHHQAYPGMTGMAGPSHAVMAFHSQPRQSPGPSHPGPLRIGPPRPDPSRPSEHHPGPTGHRPGPQQGGGVVDRKGKGKMWGPM